MMLRSFFIGLTLMLSAVCTMASDKGPTTSLITAIEYFKEDAASTVTVEQALQRFLLGEATKSERQFLSFGINESAVWIRISIHNPSNGSLHRRLSTGQIWVEHLDLYLLDDHNNILQRWQGGDAEPANQNLVPTIGFVFDVTLPKGYSQIMIRGQTLDPLTLPIELMEPSAASQQNAIAHVATGFLYGILIGLVGFNILLYTILKQTHALYYVIYIGCFIVMNIGYSGYGFAWLYPQSVVIQNYSTLFFMVLHGTCGLIFVSHFLDVPTRMPLLSRLINIYMVAGLIVISGLVLAQLHLPAASVAFSFLSVTTLVMIIIGAINFGGMPDARYFLLAVCCSMLGLLATTLTVWGVIPYTFYGFHGAEIGVVVEAIILAVLVANRLKAIESERITAKYLATYDPLTQLYNRRSFEKAAAKLILNAHLQQQPLSLVMMDIDHFKTINDTYGHHIGDLTLKHIAQLLKNYVRKGDLIARWGGEEMIVLLPETEHAEAVAFTERLRTKIKNSPLVVDGKEISVTASFGVYSDRESATFEQLFKQADKLLYRAKNQGRDRVESCLAY